MVLGVFLLVCTFALVILSSHKMGDLDDPRNTFFATVYLLPLIGEFERGRYDTRFSMAFIVVIFTLLANVVMLNMLIAIMGQSYNRVQEKINDRQLLERAMLILEE